MRGAPAFLLPEENHMKRFLLATAAVVTLAFAVPMAVAQNTSSQPTYTQTAPPVDAQMTSDASTTETQSYATQSTATPDHAPMQSTVQADPNSNNYAQSDTTLGQRAQPLDQNDDRMAATAADPQYAARADQFANSTIEPATLQEAALEAGMAGTPMNATDVCATRDVDLGSSRLTRDSRQQLRFAVDRASACEINQVVINAPRGREDAVRQLLISHGVDVADIQVQEASELGVEMRFAGVATSSEYYASIFNLDQQLAMNAPATPDGSYTPESNMTTDESMTAPDANMPDASDDPDAAQNESTTL